jgi:hypothetical protein
MSILPGNRRLSNIPQKRKQAFEHSLENTGSTQTLSEPHKYTEAHKMLLCMARMESSSKATRSENTSCAAKCHPKKLTQELAQIAQLL